MQLSPVDQAELSRFAAGISELPFVLRYAETEEDMAKACEVRRLAYGRHDAELGELLGRIEPLDRDAGTVIYMVEDKATGTCLASSRMRTNLLGPLDLHRATELPAEWTGEHLAEVTRLAALPAAGPFVVMSMMKAMWITCVGMQVRRAVIAAREKLAPSYQLLGFIDAFEDARLIPLPYAGNIPPRILHFHILSAERRWHEQGHALYDFFAKTYHPDLHIGQDLLLRRAQLKRQTAAGEATPA